MQELNTWNLNYSVEKLEELSENINPFLTSLYDAEFTVSTRDKYLLREHLMNTDVMIKMLRKDFDALNQDLKQPLWKRLFRK